MQLLRYMAFPQALEFADEDSDQQLVVRNVQVFRVGTFRGDTYDQGYLDKIVRNFQRLRRGGFTPAFTLDHSGDVQSVIGNVTDVRRKGDVLHADLLILDADAIERARRGLLSRLSVDINAEGQDDTGAVIGPVLRAIAAVAIPQVKSLQPLVINSEDGIFRAFEDDWDIRRFVWDEKENEIWHRVREPDDFQPETFRRKEIQGGAKAISIVVARLKPDKVPEGNDPNSAVVQAYRFAKKTDDNPGGWTVAEAKDWWAKHKGEHADRASKLWADLNRWMTLENRPGESNRADDGKGRTEEPKMKKFSDLLAKMKELITGAEAEIKGEDKPDPAAVAEIEKLRADLKSLEDKGEADRKQLAEEVGKRADEAAKRRATDAKHSVQAYVEKGIIAPAASAFAEAILSLPAETTLKFAEKDKAAADLAVADLFKRFVEAQGVVLTLGGRGHAAYQATPGERPEAKEVAVRKMAESKNPEIIAGLKERAKTESVVAKVLQEMKLLA